MFSIILLVSEEIILLLFFLNLRNKYCQMAIYIKGMGNISIQDTLGKNFIDAPVSYSEPYIRCIEPNFKDFINPLQLRRMSRIIKRAIASSLTAVEQSGIAVPEAIISGTGLGCIEDTEKFLSAMIENEEKFLQP